MNKSVKTAELFEFRTPYLLPLLEGSEYPWDILPKIGKHIRQLLDEGIDGFELLSDGVLVGKNAVIHPSAVIIPPAIIGGGTEIRPCAFIRGNVITGDGCVVGNSTELKNSVLLNGVQVPHYNYVGDSILGNRAHMGAGAICSNLKADGRAVIIHCEEEIETGLRKIGGFIGDGAEIGCGCVLNPGTVVGKNTSVYPLTALRGVYPSDSIVKSSTEIVEHF